MSDQVHLKAKPHVVSHFSEEQLLCMWTDRLSALSHTKRKMMGIPDPEAESHAKRYLELTHVWMERFVKPRLIQRAVNESVERMEQAWRM
jgi:hypothetical protein